MPEEIMNETTETNETIESNEASEALESNEANVKSLIIDRAAGTAIILGALAGGALIVLSALAARSLNRERGRARYHIEKTAAYDYDRADRRKILKSIRKYSRKAEKAKTVHGARNANKKFQTAVEGIQTRAEKLADKKIDAVEKLYEGGFVRGKVKYGADFSVSDYVERIKEAPDMESLNKVLKELR